MRNFSLGVGRRDLIIFAGSTILMLVLTIVWDLFLVETISSQALNKYFLTLVLFALAAVVAFLSAVAAGRSAGIRGMLPSLVTRFGLALQIFGTMITPIGLFYATNPTRSVPVGFAAFSAVMLGMIIAGVGGNMLVPRRS
jgi:predicted neutral ceramidase superfamily lipid hydrolase